MKVNRVTAAALTYVALVSSASIAIKIGLRTCQPLTLLTLRFLTAGLGMLLLARSLAHAFPANRHSWARILVFGFLNVALPAIFVTIGLRFTSAAASSIVLATQPLVLTLASAWFLGEKLTTRRV